MLFDPMLKYYSQIQDLYNRIDGMSFDKMNDSYRMVFSMQVMCEFVSIMKAKHKLTEQNLAEILNLPLFVIQEIEKNEFAMSKKQFDRIMRKIGEERESIRFCQRLNRKLS